MRAAAILGLGCTPKNLKPFQTDNRMQWQLGVPAQGQADVILIFGGDGTIHRHLNQLVKLNVPLLAVPAGSGNDFARALGLRRRRDSLTAWQRFCRAGDNVRDLDLGAIFPQGAVSQVPCRVGSDRAEQPSALHYFCTVAGIGLDAEVARSVSQLPRWFRGHGGYALRALPEIFRFAPFALKIEVAAETKNGGARDWTTRLHRPAMLAAFANAPFYGSGMNIAPRARMDDGLLDACVIGAVGRCRLLCMFPTVYSGRHLKVREVEYFPASRFRVETERPFPIYADGEFVCPTPVEIGVEPKAWQVIVSEDLAGEGR
jgi:diacylglycerol kinase (ATP)